MRPAQPELVAHVLDQIARHAGLVFSDVRLVGATETIAAWLAHHQLDGSSQILPGAELDGLLEELVVHESYFDRDIEQLAMVDELVLSRFARSREPLRIWSAGCAAGEEPYTLAFMLARRDLLSRATIVGTDLSRAALARARAGTYRGWSVRVVAADSPAMRFLEHCGPDLCVPAHIKRAVRFAPLNLLEDPYPADQHLVVCRNVLIYFDKAAVAVIAQKLAASLHPDGWLFVAPSDPRLDPHAALTPVITDRGIYYRHSGPQPPRAKPRVTEAAPAPRWRDARPTQTPPPPVQRVVPVTHAPTVAILARDRARQLADRGDYIHARQVLTSALEATPLDAELYFLSAVLTSDSDVTAALGELERAMYLAPDAPLSYMFAARLHHSRGDVTGARRAYRRALRLLEPLPADAHLPWTDEPAHVLVAACRAALGGHDD